MRTFTSELFEAFESVGLFFIALLGTAFVVLMPAWSAVKVLDLAFAIFS